MLPPTTEPLPRVHRLFASDRLQGSARRPKAAMPPSPLSTTAGTSLGARRGASPGCALCMFGPRGRARAEETSS